MHTQIGGVIPHNPVNLFSLENYPQNGTAHFKLLLSRFITFYEAKNTGTQQNINDCM